VFTLGGSELIIIVVLALLLFGPDKIPQLAKTIGRFTREFNKYKDIMESTIRMEISRAEGPTTDEMTVEERIAKAGAASQALLAEQTDKTAAAEAASPGETETPGEAAAPTFAPPAPAADEADEEDEG
jgi:TatA/E family protein of Tat protein translocase